MSAATKKQIEQEIRTIQSGLKGESEAAHIIDFDFGNDSKNWAVIHDLRLEYNGNVAQIDHLLVNRCLELYVCESKRFREGIGINSQGEFYAYYNKEPYGIASPIEQNNRHKTLLRRIFDNDVMELPLRLGVKMKPSLHSLILIGNDAIIRRPKNGKNVDELDRIIKNEQLKKRIFKDFDNFLPNNLLHQIATTAKIISRETLYEFAENLAALHQPIENNWKARFGIQDRQPENTAVNAMSVQQQPVKTLFCCACRRSVTETVANYCWKNKNRFGGKVYCYNCQKNVL
ncbi:nuclease-related domain-containing protein [Neisseriaceae bacterium B1]